MNPSVAHGLAAFAGGIAAFCILNAFAARAEKRSFEAVGSFIIGCIFAGAAMFLVTL